MKYTITNTNIQLVNRYDECDRFKIIKITKKHFFNNFIFLILYLVINSLILN